jgi:PAS domain S-box-containing protein/putative nucleotidyltransferase with HDIG domain
VQDRDLRYEWVVNPALGMTPDDFIGKTDADLLDAEQFEMLRALKQQVIDSGEALHVEVPLTDAHGTMTVYDGSYVPRRDAEGNVTGILSYFRDVTESRRAEDLLARYQLLSSEARDIMLFVRASDGAIVEANAAAEAAYGYSREELLRLSINVFRSALDGPTIDIQMKAAEAEGILFETEHQRKDGSSFPVEVSSRGATMIDGEKVLLSVIRDITERKHAEAALIESTVQLKRTLQAAVAALGATTELRDPYTAGHQRRVSNLARAIAAEMELPNDRIEGLRVAAIIHDIGKVSVPADILGKPGKLTDIEFSLIKTHAQAGYDILKDINFPWPVARMVIEHHERIDGSGYPQMLIGENILLEARILCVADVVEAISSHRPYRPALGIDFALDEISRNRGTLYDANVVDACLRLFRTKEFSFG